MTPLQITGYILLFVSLNTLGLLAALRLVRSNIPGTRFSEMPTIPAPARIPTEFVTGAWNEQT